MAKMDNPENISTRHLVVMRNLFCVYCAVSLYSFKGGEREHVIGRRFVPKGTLSGQWNLIVRSCPNCNDYKADLEDDLSAITMQPDVSGRLADDDDRLRSEAARKARTKNRRTQRRVSEPNPPIIVGGNFGAGQFTFQLTSPAQPEEDRVFELARLQLVGFFSMLTYDNQARRGFFWSGNYEPVVIAHRGDWGNPRLSWIDAMSCQWESRLHAIGADGFYKLWIRRKPNGPAVWSWAMEWNKSYRIAGFFGDADSIQDFLRNLPTLNFKILFEDASQRVRWRKEIPLAEQDDILFVDLNDRVTVNCAT